MFEIKENYFTNPLKIIIMREKNNSQIIQKDIHLSVQNVSGTYIAPDIEVIDIELGQNILAVSDLTGDEL